MMEVPPMDAETAQVLSSPPFIQIEGVVNLRGVGGYAIVDDPGRCMKADVVFRSGEPTRITVAGTAKLKTMISTVFDMRSPKELTLSPSVLGNVEGITVIPCPLFENAAYDPVSLQKRLQSFTEDEQKAFRVLYHEILEYGGETWGVVLRHLRDEPASPCLVHCTAGKDRTGIFIALLLLLLGVSDEDIIKDYSLTTIGLMPALPLLVARFEKQPIFRENAAGTINMAKSEPQTMAAVLQMIREEFGGVKQYLQKYANLTPQDFEIIRNNLTESRDVDGDEKSIQGSTKKHVL